MIVSRASPGPSCRWRPVGPGLLLLLGACAGAGTGSPTITREAFASVQQSVRTDPGFRATEIEKCIGRRAAEPQAAREMMARMLAVDAAVVDRVYCERQVDAVASGRISYEDYVAIATHRADAATSARFMEAISGSSPSPRVEAADQLDAYARLLRETGRKAQADEMAADAERLRQSERESREAQRAATEGRPYETSTYLGFMPDRLLQQYAAELRRLGRTAEAERAEAVATRYREEQTRAVDALARRHSAPQAP